jgi:tRNA(Ile)-lysidine synthetase-like protein
MRLGMASLSAASARTLLAGGNGSGTSFAIFDADSLALPLSVQGTDSGRKMTPFGMEGQRRLRDLLAESGVPRADRASYPLVLDRTGTPLWLPGVRSSACAPLTSRSERAIMLYTIAAFGYDPAVLEMDS